MNIKICHLYPDVLNLYGDRGNVICMQKRLEWRGIKTEVAEVPIGEALNVSDFDIFFIGGGQDFEQGILLNDLARGKSRAIVDAVNDEKVFLAICGGYQMLGNYYKTWDGKQCDFIGAVDFYTIGQKERTIGNYMFNLCEDSTVPTIVGFENHSGKTYLGNGVQPLGKIVLGSGNNGSDATEGARYKNVFCTYSHGPLLPKNVQLCDLILNKAVERKYGKVVLPELDDTLENAANSYMVNKLNSN